jgi:oligo-1,6-glucosidase/alpha-glucosidase
MSIERKPEWWKSTTVYQIYPRSFADSNGDGIGDLDGIISKLDYLVSLGIETIWFSPFYDSPQADFGYDISNYRGVSSDYGNMETVQKLIDEVHVRGMRVVFDMVLNHTSDQHPWFLESRSSKDNPKRDWYIWLDGKKPGGKKPPNNWHAMIGGCGWHYDEKTDQWFWAQFLPFQPDLNYRNPEVQKEMLDTMRFWLDKGVDGFRLDIVNAIFEDADFKDNPFAWTLIPSDEDPTMAFQGSENTLNHADTIAFTKVLRDTVDEYGKSERFLVGEVNAPIEMAKAHCGENADGLNLVFVFKSLTTPLKAKSMRNLIAEYESYFQEPHCPTWVFGNHDRARRIMRLDNNIRRAKLNAAWQLTARGVPFIYYGEEIGQLNQRIPAKDSQDAVAIRMNWLPQVGFDAIRKFAGESLNRDECRTPMQWTEAKHAGFCPDDVTPWLPLPGNKQGRTVEEQENDPDSLLSCYKRFLKVRKETPALHRGSLSLLDADTTGKDVVGYVRETDGQRVLVLLNASCKPSKVTLPEGSWTMLVSTLAERPDVTSGSVILAAGEGLVLVKG